MPIFFHCRRCTACCRWPGEVRLSDDEISRLAEFKGLDFDQFVQQFTRLAHYRHGLALAEKTNGECIFLQGRDCTVQAVKPQQCRDFPNRWRFPGFEAACQAVPTHVTPEEYERLILETTGQPVPEPAFSAGNGTCKTIPVS